MKISKFKIVWFLTLLQLVVPVLAINGYISEIYGFLGFLIFGFAGLIFGRCPNCHELINTSKKGWCSPHYLFLTTCNHCGQNTNKTEIESIKIRNK